MSDAYARFYPRRHSDSNATCALCVVQNHKGQRPIVTVYFPPAIYERLQILSLRPDIRGQWIVGSTVTSVRKLTEWLKRYEAWEAVRDAETVLFGDTWKSADDWRYYLARAT